MSFDFKSVSSHSPPPAWQATRPENNFGCLQSCKTWYNRIMRTYLSADFHLNHSNIVKYCGRTSFMSEGEKDQYLANPSNRSFKISRDTTQRMDETIIDSINRLIQPDDILYFLGDFCFAPRRYYYETAKRYRSQINCQNIYMIWGNHDQHSIRDLFSGAFDLTTVQINGHPVVLSHYAMAIWDRRHHGSYNFHGHSHGRAEAWLDSIMPGRFSMDVGVDHAFMLFGEYRPFDFEVDILPVFAKRSGFGLLSKD